MNVRCLRLLVIVVIAVVVSSCGPHTSIIGSTSVSLDEVRVVEGVPWNAGFPGLKPIVIGSRAELNVYIEYLDGYTESGYDPSRCCPQPLIAPLRNDSTNFYDYNIIVFPREEFYGNVEYSVQTPVRRGGEVVIRIDRIEPEGYLYMISQHVFAYRVSKSIDAVVFDFEGELTRFENSE